MTTLLIFIGIIAHPLNVIGLAHTSSERNNKTFMAIIHAIFVTILPIEIIHLICNQYCMQEMIIAVLIIGISLYIAYRMKHHLDIIYKIEQVALSRIEENKENKE